ncbi:MAG: AbiEi antitoxin N-terminal domain-containing protein [Anaeromyxobacter sp.]
MASTSKLDALLRLARAGPLRARDLEGAGIPRTYLRRLTDRGLLEQLDRGLYGLPDAPVTELHSVAQVAKRIPHATVALLSALQIHGLTSEAPHAVWLLIDRGARTPRVGQPRLEVVRASGAARTHGIERHVIEGVNVGITTPAKTVADCFRYRRHVGLEVALAALRAYLGRPKATRPERSRLQRGSPIDALIEAAKADRIYSVLRPYLEALA